MPFFNLNFELLTNLIKLFKGSPVLHTSMAVEELGGWKGVSSLHGSQYRTSLRCGEETKKEATY